MTKIHEKTPTAEAIERIRRLEIIRDTGYKAAEQTIARAVAAEREIAKLTHGGLYVRSTVPPYVLSPACPKCSAVVRIMVSGGILFEDAQVECRGCGAEFCADWTPDDTEPKSG